MTPKSSLCPFCQKKGTPEFLACLICKCPLHPGCLGLTNKPSAAVKAVLTSPWFASVCQNCRDTKVPLTATDGVAHTLTSGSLESTLSKLEAVTTSLQSLVVGTEPRPSSFAEAAARGRRPPSTNLASALLEAEKAKESEEKRLRSAVLSGLPEIDGISDQERVCDLLATAGVDGSVEIVEVFRMGPEEPPAWHVSATARAQSSTDVRKPRPYIRKLKLVTKSPQQLATLLGPAVRDATRNPASDFSAAFLAPSRTAAERRYLALLRKRRWLLNCDIEDPEDHWLIDNRRHVLVERSRGRILWSGPGDSGLVQWMREEESKPHYSNARHTTNSISSRRPSQSDNPGSLRRGSLAGN